MDGRRNRYAKKIDGKFVILGTLLIGADKKELRVGNLTEFTVIWFKLSQEWRLSRAVDKVEGLIVEFEGE